MGLFQSGIVRGLDRVYATAGEAAVYTNRLAQGTPCTVLLETDLTRYGEQAQVNVRTAVLSVRVAQVAAAPRQGETFLIGARTWRVDSLQASDALEHRVFVA